MLVISFCHGEMFINIKFLHQKAYHIAAQYIAWIAEGNQLWQLLATSLGAEKLLTVIGRVDLQGPQGGKLFSLQC